LTDKEFWYGFSNAYQCSDDLFTYKEKIKFHLSINKNRPFREYFMTSYERGYFKKLPSEIRIYRGMTFKEYESKDFGISWTLSEKIADFFAYKYQRNFSVAGLPKMVHSQTIDKKFVLGYLSGRKEKEVVLDIS
jgi:hypothetical protein